MRTLTITYGENTRGSWDFDVIDEHGRRTQALTFGEMLEQITELTHPRIAPRERYPMLTDDEWAERDERRRVARELRRSLEATGVQCDAIGPIPF